MERLAQKQARSKHSRKCKLVGWPLFNRVNGWIKHCNDTSTQKEGICIITLTSQLYRFCTLTSSITTTLEVWEVRCYFCCLSKEGTLWLRSENFHSRSHGQLVAVLQQTGDSFTPSSIPFFQDHTYFCIILKDTKHIPFFSPSSLAAFSFLKKNRTMPS